jgi:hypothetical protein
MNARPDYEPLFSILDGLRLDSERRNWIERREVEGNFSDIQVDSGQEQNFIKANSYSQGARVGFYIRHSHVEAVEGSMSRVDTALWGKCAHSPGACIVYIALALTWIAKKAGLYFISTNAQGNVAVGCGGMSCSVIYRMCYTFVCGLR